MAGFPQKAGYTGIDNIINGFNVLSQGRAYYSVWQRDTVPLFAWNEDDYEQGLQFLEQNLQAGEQNGHNELLCIRFHPSKCVPHITHKSPVIASMYIRICPIDGATSKVNSIAEPLPAKGAMTFEQFEVMQALRNLPNELKAATEAQNERIRLLEEKLNDPKDEPDYIGQITGLLNNPTIVNTALGFLGMLFPHLNPANKMQTQPINGLDQAPEPEQIRQETANNTEITETEYWDKIDTVLDRLSRHCDLLPDLTKLAELAEQNPANFKFLLTSLRSQ